MTTTAVSHDIWVQRSHRGGPWWAFTLRARWAVFCACGVGGEYVHATEEAAVHAAIEHQTAPFNTDRCHWDPSEIIAIEMRSDAQLRDLVAQADAMEATKIRRRDLPTYFDLTDRICARMVELGHPEWAD